MNAFIRKQSRGKSIAEISPESDIEDEFDEFSKTRAARMNADGEELFVQTCVKHLDYINDNTTIRGTPGSKNVQLMRNKTNDAWEQLTTEMNDASNVSGIFGSRFIGQTICHKISLVEICFVFEYEFIYLLVVISGCQKHRILQKKIQKRQRKCP